MSTLSEEAEDLLLHTTGNCPSSPKTGRNMLVCPKDPAVPGLTFKAFLTDPRFKAYR